MRLTFVDGHYFPYCKFCVHDNVCELHHHEYTGASSLGSLVRHNKPFDHEDLRGTMAIFQKGTTRECCSGKIGVTGSPFLPLRCQCGTVLGSITLSGGHMCQKFIPTKEAIMQLAKAQEIAKEKGFTLPASSIEELLDLPLYRAHMER